MNRFRKPTTRPSRRISRINIKCFDGPLVGKTLNLDRDAQLSTLPITLHGCIGRYVAGRWETA